MLSQDQVPNNWLHGMPQYARWPALGKIAAGAKCYLGSISMSVDGLVMPVLSGTAMAAKAKTFAGGDANSGLIVLSRSTGVRVALISGAAESISTTMGGTTIDIGITYNNTVSTPNSLANLVRGHAEADRLLRVKATGTGAGTAITAAALAAVPAVLMMGQAPQRLDNSDSSDPTPLPPSICFPVGPYGVQADPSNLPPLNGEAFIVDDNTISSVADPLAFRCPVRYVDSKGMYYADLSAAV